MRADEILRELIAHPSSIRDLDARGEAGVYALFLVVGTEFPIDHDSAQPVYIGTSGNLAQREFDTHFAAGQSGFSTVRRTFGPCSGRVSTSTPSLGARARARPTSGTIGSTMQGKNA